MTFGGEWSVTVPAGATALSDPLPGRLPAETSLVVSLYVAEAGGPATGHGMAMQTSYTTEGDHTAEENPDNWTGTTGSWFYLDAVTVRTRSDVGALVALGDSITDGWQSTTDRNRRWPDYLARHLQADPDTDIKGVANEGISGNKVLADGAGQSALNRLHRDAAEAVRREVNAFIRTSGEFDAVADFDRVLRSPYDHERILPFFDNGDHLHPNDTGMQAMADAVPLKALSCDRHTA